MTATRKDRAWYYERKKLQSSGRKDGNESGLNSTKGNKNKLVDRNRALAEKVEGLYIGKELETFKEEWKPSFTKGGVSKAVRKLMGRSVNWEDEREEEEGQAVREWGRRIVAGEWSIGEEPLVKEWQVTGRESMTSTWVFKNSIAPELSQIQPFYSYLDWAKCNLDESPNPAWICARYEYLTRKVKPILLSNGCITDAGLDRRGSAIARAVPIPRPWDRWIIPFFSHGDRGRRLTPERLWVLWIGSLLWPKEKEALLGMLSNREYALSWTWEELEMISNKVEPPHPILL